MDDSADYSKRIRELFPEIAIDSIKVNRDGLLNDVVIVNSEFVFRFAKPGFGVKDLIEEARVLHFLKNHITLQIPDPFYESQDLLAYRLIEGQTLRRDILLRLAGTDQQAAADQLAQFLKELHSIPLSEISTH